MIVRPFRVRRASLPVFHDGQVRIHVSIRARNMIHLRESRSTLSSRLRHRHRVTKTPGAIHWRVANVRPNLLFAMVGLGVLGVGCAALALAVASGSSFLLAFLRDAGQQVGRGRLAGSWRCHDVATPRALSRGFGRIAEDDHTRRKAMIAKALCQKSHAITNLRNRPE
jgi:hypothetical protein